MAGALAAGIASLSTAPEVIQRCEPVAHAQCSLKNAIRSLNILNMRMQKHQNGFREMESDA